MCRALAAAQPNHQSDIATTDYGLSGDWLEHVRSRAPASTSIKIFSESKWLDKGWSLPLIKWLWRRASDYDVVHIHALFSSTSSAAAWVCNRKQVPFVIRPLGTLSPYTFANKRRLLKRLYFRLLDMRALRHACAIQFTTSQEFRKTDRLRLATRNVVVPIPYDLINIRQSKASEDPTILFLSRLHPVKGLELLLQAISVVRATLPSVRLVVAGAGDAGYESSVRARARKLQLDDVVTFAGFVEGAAKEALFEKASVFALLSHQENFGVAVAEALARGIPVIITEGVDLADDVRAYQSGYVVNRDVGHVANALVKLLSDALLRRTMGANGRRQVAELYAPSKVGLQLESLYRSCVEGTGSR
jgi:glycosyltransferase involved in cell wall biosynthesis